MRENKILVLQNLGGSDLTLLELLEGCEDITDQSFWAKVIMGIASSTRSSLLMNHVCFMLCEAHNNREFLSEVANTVVHGYPPLTIMNYKGNEEILRIYNHYAVREDQDPNLLKRISDLKENARTLKNSSKNYWFHNMLTCFSNVGIFGNLSQDGAYRKAVRPTSSPNTTIGKKTN